MQEDLKERIMELLLDENLSVRETLKVLRDVGDVVSKVRSEKFAEIEETALGEIFFEGSSKHQ